MDEKEANDGWRDKGANENYDKMEMRHHQHRKVIKLRDKSIFSEVTAADFCRVMSVDITGNLSLDLLKRGIDLNHVLCRSPLEQGSAFSKTIYKCEYTNR